MKNGLVMLHSIQLITLLLQEQAILIILQYQQMLTRDQRMIFSFHVVQPEPGQKITGYFSIGTRTVILTIQEKAMTWGKPVAPELRLQV